MPSPIFINARAAARPELGGVERWSRELARRLPLLRPDAYLVAWPRPRLVHRLGHAWEQIALPAVAAQSRASLVLSPANLAPVAWPRNVVVVHDAAALRHPRFYAPTYVAWQRAVLPVIARSAVRVIAPSSFSRDEVIDLLGASPDRVVTIAGGVDERFAPEGDAAGRAARSLGLDRPYVLTVGSLIERKNLAALATAAKALAGRGLDLVSAGGGRPHLRAEQRAVGIRALGHVDDAVLPGLYAGAQAFVLASHHEGFGLTCLEAMASGVPVVASDRGALAETCAGAALLVEPDDHHAIAEAVIHAVQDEDARVRMVAAGLARARQLTWDRTARKVDELLEELR